MEKKPEFFSSRKAKKKFGNLTMDNIYISPIIYHYYHQYSYQSQINYYYYCMSGTFFRMKEKYKHLKTQNNNSYSIPRNLNRIHTLLVLCHIFK